MTVVSTNWSQNNPNSSNWVVGNTYGTKTKSIGTPIGLLLALTQAAQITVPITSNSLNFATVSPNSTNWS